MVRTGLGLQFKDQNCKNEHIAKVIVSLSIFTHTYTTKSIYGVGQVDRKVHLGGQETQD